jgi:RHS repeat-associated protein
MPLSVNSKSLRAGALRFRWNGSYGYRTLYLLSGQQTTNTATLMHVGARHYSPSLRRWLQRDPSGLVGGTPNPYVFCVNDPVGLVDVDGTRPLTREDIDRLRRLYWWVGRERIHTGYGERGGPPPEGRD